MAKDKKRRRRKGLVSKLILSVFVIYASTVLISNYMEAGKIKAECASEDEQIETQSMRKAYLEEMLNTEPDEEYMTQEAQNQGYGAPDERVFVDSSGN